MTEDRLKMPAAPPGYRIVWLDKDQRQFQLEATAETLAKVRDAETEHLWRSRYAHGIDQRAAWEVNE